MTSKARIGLWFAGAATIFFTRAFLYSTWVSRGPEVQDALAINTAQMGLLAMLYPAGGLAGVMFAASLVHRYGTRTVNTATFAVAAAAFAVLGFAVDSGNFLVSCICLFFMGLPMALSDFIGNLEGTAVDKAAKRSIFSAIHGLFGIGMLVGAGLASWLINAGVSLSISFLTVGIFIGVVSIVGGYGFPKHKEPDVSAAKKAENRKVAAKVWTEKRSLLLAVVGFTFIMAEMSAGIWVPLALTRVGYSGAEAAAAFGVFWIVITLVRLVGGYVLDLIGRYKLVLASIIFTAVGMVVFMTSEATHLEYLGLILWGLGVAVGFPMVIASMSDDQSMAAPRVNMIITVVYISSITVGPALGALGQAAGIYVAFSIPLALVAVSLFLSRATKPLESK